MHGWLAVRSITQRLYLSRYNWASMKTVVIVGAGMGGLSTAARLAKSGCEVTVFEARPQIGGRLGELRRDGYRFDTGPTLLMMLEPLERLFGDLHRRVEDYLDLALIDPSYRVYFGDGTVFDSTPNIARMTREITRKISPDEVPGYLRLMGDLSAMYHAVVPAFVRKQYRGLGDLFTPSQVGLLLRHRLLSNLWKRVAGYVHDPRLRMLFSFQTMYLGLSPKEALWVYGVLTYMESGEGVWYPRGGMHRLPEAIARVAQEEGARLYLNHRVQEVLIAGDRAVGVRLQSGEVLKADVVVVNVDAPTAYRELLPPTPYAKRNFKNSCSALMFYIGYTEPLPHQLHHNVYFSRDFEANLRELFEEQRVPSDPSFYTCLSNRTDPADAPAGCENLYVLVPAPNLTGEDARAAAPRVLETVIERVGLKRECMQFVEMLTPHEWQAMGLWQGAAFGIAHTFFQSTAFRPSVQTPFGNCYLVGASTQPGNGIPMTLISAELVAERILGKQERKG
ncbi:MAG: phytoene desaturase family protein [Fimbriimonadales bacterium]